MAQETCLACKGYGRIKRMVHYFGSSQYEFSDCPNCMGTGITILSDKEQEADGN